MTANQETGTSEMARPEDLQIWRDEGRFEEIDGHNLFVHASGTPKNPGHGVLITHGFPGSSIDWKHVVPRVALHTRVVVSDFLGFGQSDKPTDGTFETHYSLFQRADRMIEIARREGLEEVVLVIHDMGQTVGAEIMARHEEGKLPFKIKHAIILNGSTLVDMVHFVPEQVKMLECGNVSTIYGTGRNLLQRACSLPSTAGRDGRPGPREGGRSPFNTYESLPVGA
jgi:pimeloyl-ACP methyl ester carboxylesterase